MQSSGCFGHMNGFQHLSIMVLSPEEPRDIGYKIEYQESNLSTRDPSTNVEVWTEPYLALYVSVCTECDCGNPSTLLYGLTRGKFDGNKLVPSDRDSERLIELAKQEIPNDVRVLLGGGDPGNLKKTRFL